MAMRVAKALLEFVGLMLWWWVVLPAALIFAALVDHPLAWLAVLGLLAAAVLVKAALARRHSPSREES